MTRLLINLFFIIIMCFTLAAMPINTQILDLFDFGELFSKEEPDEIIDETEKEIETFQAEFTYTLNSLLTNRTYNPTSISLNLATNLTDELLNEHSIDTFELLLYHNDMIYQIFQMDQFIANETQSYNDNFITMDYEIDLSKNTLNIDQEGFYNVVIRRKVSEEKLLSFDVAYLKDLDYVKPSATNDNFPYQAYFFNDDKSSVIPLSLNMKSPESITVAVRNSLYQIPSLESGLAQQGMIPEYSSISRLAQGYYGVYLSSSKLETIISNNSQAELMIEALTKTLLDLDHIDKVSVYVDNRQTAGSLYDVDLSVVHEEDPSIMVYLPQISANKTYLVPSAITTTDKYDAIFEIIEILKSGNKNDKEFKALLPPDLLLNNILIEGTQVTLDFNQHFMDAFPGLENYQSLMINSLLYSITSIDGIDTVAITVDGSSITNFAGFDFTLPQSPLEYINYVGQFN